MSEQGWVDRRHLLALAAAMPLLSSGRASACSPVLTSPRTTGLQNQQVRSLFAAWSRRDKDEFQRIFTDTLMLDGSPMEARLAAELRQKNPIPSGEFDIFERFFADERKTSRMTLLVNTAAGIFVACSEESFRPGIEADCTGMPLLHLFLVSMSGLNARSVKPLATTATPEVGKVSIWTDG